MAYTRQTIRLAVDLGQPSGVVSVDGQSPWFWRNNDVALELAFFSAGALIDVSGLASLSLKIKELDDITGTPLASITATGFNASLTQAQWDAGTGQHITATLTKEQTSLALVGLESYFHLVMSALSTDEPAKEITLGVATLLIVEDGRSGTMADPVPADQYYTREESAARYVVLSALAAHAEDASNPHSVTKTQVGLGNVDNTADASKPVSTAQASAIAAAVAPKADSMSLVQKADAAALNDGLALKANLLNPVFTESITVPTGAFPDEPGIKFGRLGTKFLSCDGSDYTLGGGGRLQVGGSWVVTEATITKTMIGLGSVNNTADSAKPVSGPHRAALDLKEDLANKDEPNGYAGLDSSGKINPSQLPAISSTDTFVIASQSAMLGLSTADVGDMAVRTDESKTYILKESDASVLAHWQELLFPVSPVSSFLGRTGAVTAQSNDYDAGQIAETSARVFVTPAQKTVLGNTSGTNTGDQTLSGLGGVASTDSRLTDARNAADVYSWAKAATKPAYTVGEVTGAASLTSPPFYGIVSTWAGDVAVVGFKLINSGVGGRSYSLVSGIRNVGQSGFSIFDETVGITRLVISAGGNVVIGGTTDAGYKMDVIGSLRAYNQTLLTGGIDGVYGDMMTFAGVGYPTTYLHKIKTSHSLVPAYSKMAFSLTTGVSTFTDVLTLKGDGTSTFIGAVTATSFIGSGASLTGITPGQIGAAPSSTVSFPGFGMTGTTACAGNDSRLSNARTPTPHSHATSDVTNLDTALSGKCSSTDSRLSDARPASDVYSWAKAGTKPAYTASEVGADASGAASAVQGSLTTHASLTTAAHGGLVSSSDSRLSDARTPVAHTQAISTITGLDTALAGKAPLAGAAFTGAITAPTVTAGDYLVGTALDTPTITFVGDSLSTLHGSISHSIDWYVTMPAYNGQTFVKTNIAVWGKFLVDMVDDAPTNLIPLYHSKAGLNIAVIWAGTNDIQPSPSSPHTVKTAGQVFSSLREFSLKLRRLGFKTIVCTLTSSVLDETKRQALNALMRATWQEWSDSIADFGANPTIGGNAVYGNTTYFLDTLHLTDAGNAIAGAILNLAVQRLFSQYGDVWEIGARTFIGGSTYKESYLSYNLCFSNGWQAKDTSDYTSMVYQYGGYVQVWTGASGSVPGSIKMQIAPDGTTDIKNCLTVTDAGVSNWRSGTITAYASNLTQGVSIGYAGISKVGTDASGPLDINAKGDGALNFQNVSTGAVNIGTALNVIGAISGPGTGLTGTASGLTAGSATNADTVDGHHLNQDVSTASTPTFGGLTLTNNVGLVISRSGTNVGSVFLGTGGTHYLLWDATDGRGACYSLGGTEGLRINGSLALTTASAIPTSQITGLDTALEGKAPASTVSFPGFGTMGTTACAGNDSRLSDARTPTAHSHSTLSNLTVQDTTNANALSGTLLVMANNMTAGVSIGYGGIKQYATNGELHVNANGSGILYLQSAASGASGGVVVETSIKSAAYKSADGTTGATQDVTISGMVLHFKNGLFVGIY